MTFEMEKTVLQRRIHVTTQIQEHRRRHPDIWMCPNCRTVHPIHRWHHGTVDGREYCDYCDAKRVILNHMKPTSWRRQTHYCGKCGWREQVQLG